MHKYAHLFLHIFRSKSGIHLPLVCAKVLRASTGYNSACATALDVPPAMILLDHDGRDNADPPRVVFACLRGEVGTVVAAA